MTFCQMMMERLGRSVWEVYCPKNRLSSYKLWQLVQMKQNEVKELVDKGQSFDVIIHVSAHPPLEETANGEVRVD